jgi:leucyl/phenylalanyl-tRNA--protein transferase
LKTALRLTPDKSALTAPLTGAEAVTYALQPTTQAS